jgi:hypothetical protein
LAAIGKIVGRYWHDAFIQMDDFKNEGVVASGSWPFQVGLLKADTPIASTIPQEGATGWADTTMMHVDSKHPNCAYKWMEHSLASNLQSDLSVWFGLSGGVMEASADLGANAFQTFWYVLLPNLGTALLAGGMLAFALSFDEVIVTTFTAGQQATLPIWMLEELIRPSQRPVTNVVAMVVFAATVLPILAAYLLTRKGSETAGSGK